MEKRFIGVQELANYLGLSPKTIYKWVSLRRIPHYRLGSKPKFVVSEINTWIAKKKVKVSFDDKE